MQRLDPTQVAWAIKNVYQAFDNKRCCTKMLCGKKNETKVFSAPVGALKLNT